MRRTEIRINDVQFQHLSNEARERGISRSALIRALIDEYFAGSRMSRAESLYSLKGIGKGPGDPVGRDHNRYLYGEY